MVAVCISNFFTRSRRWWWTEVYVDESEERVSRRAYAFFSPPRLESVSVKTIWELRSFVINHALFRTEAINRIFEEIDGGRRRETFRSTSYPRFFPTIALIPIIVRLSSRDRSTFLWIETLYGGWKQTGR